MKFFNNSKINYKLSGKFLRVWTKNQFKFEIFENILKFTYENLNGKLIFTNFLSDLQEHLSVYTTLENNTLFLQQFFFCFEGTPPPAGAPVFRSKFIRSYSSALECFIYTFERSRIRTLCPVE